MYCGKYQYILFIQKTWVESLLQGSDPCQCDSLGYMFACAGVCVCEGEGVGIWGAEGSIKDDFTAVVTYE